MQAEIERYYDSVALQTLFPTVIGISDFPDISKVQQGYIDIIEGLEPANDTKLYYYDFHKDSRFSLLIDWITESVNSYAQAHGFPNTYEVYDSWCIDYQKHVHNSAHVHQGHHISAVFYLEAYSDDVPITFIGPGTKDMVNPFNISTKDNHKSQFFNNLSFPSYWYYPITGRLLIFRSSTEHEVAPKKNDKRRLVLSFNFDPVK